MVKWIAGAVGILLFIGALIGVYAFGPKDDEMIYDALEDSIQASQEGRPYGVLERLASGFTYNSEQVTSRADVARVIRELRPKVTILSRELRIEEDEALLTSPASVMFGEGGRVDLPRVDIVFQRTSGFRWVFFPYANWKVKSVKAEGFDPAAIMGGMVPF
jgi:hypothetical protein